MPIVGDHPETGFRVVLERPHGDDAPYAYEGFVFLPAEKFAAHVVVDGQGDVTVTLDAASLRAVRMPARDRFVPDERAGHRRVR